MPFVYNHTFGCTLGSQSMINGLSAVQCGGDGSLIVLIPPASVNLLIPFTLDLTKSKILGLSSDVPMTVKTNSGTSPIATVPLPGGGVGPVWDATIWPAASHPFFGANVTALYITCPLGGTLTLVNGFTSP